VESGSFATLLRGSISLKSSVLPAIDVDVCRLAGEDAMTHSDLVRIEVQGADILVAMRGTCFRVKYRKQEAPWLSVQEYGPDDPDATITLSEFRALAWAAANDKARELGWLA
jgi:hypothetical protein